VKAKADSPAIINNKIKVYTWPNKSSIKIDAKIKIMFDEKSISYNEINQIIIFKRTLIKPIIPIIK